MSSSVSSLAQSPIVLTAVLEPVVLEARLVSLLLLTISAAARVVRSRVSSRCSSGDTESQIQGENMKSSTLIRVKLNRTLSQEGQRWLEHEYNLMF